jgi:red chlorophyll catabolite reductase
VSTSHFPIFNNNRQLALSMLLRPDHRLRFRSPPATTLASFPVFTTLAPVSRPRLRLCGALRPARARPSSLTVRASAGSDAAVARAPEMPQREVARTIAAEAEARLGSRLLPSAVPADVAEFRNGAGNAVGSLGVRRGVPGSSVQFRTLVAGIR